MALLENRKQALLILVAVIIGFLAVLLTSKYVTDTINQNTTQLKEEYDAKQQEIVSQLQQQSEAQTAALREELEKLRQESDQKLQAQMALMQQMQQQKAQAEVVKKPKPSLALRTPVGKRAVTVMIDSLAAVGGLLNAGDFVDVIAHLNVPQADEEKKKTVTAMVFQNLQVLAINTNLEEPGMYDDQQALPALKITFAVDPNEAGLLSFADKNGKIELALRSPEEGDKQVVKASTWKTLADYVLENQGANIRVPDEDGNQKVEDVAPVKPSVQIFRAGKEL